VHQSPGKPLVEVDRAAREGADPAGDRARATGADAEQHVVEQLVAGRVPGHQPAALGDPHRSLEQQLGYDRARQPVGQRVAAGGAGEPALGVDGDQDQLFGKGRAHVEPPVVVSVRVRR
jgi:hypothetical protein